MSRVLTTEPVEVRIGECECPGTPHADTGDRAWLRPRLTAEGGMAASYVLATLQKGEGVTDYMVKVGLVLLDDGLLRWDILDDAGEPASHDPQALRSGIYDYESTLKPIVDKAFDLYQETVMRPLEDLADQMESAKKKKGKRSSRSGRTNGSTSQSRGSSAGAPKPSGPSTTPTMQAAPTPGRH